MEMEEAGFTEGDHPVRDEESPIPQLKKDHGSRFHFPISTDEVFYSLRECTLR